MQHKTKTDKINSRTHKKFRLYKSLLEFSQKSLSVFLISLLLFSGLPLPIFADTDTDADGLSDNWEIQYFGDITTYDQYDDTDRDGVPNFREFALGTNPTVGNGNVGYDTDGDGVNDDDEIRLGSNPTNPASVPIRQCDNNTDPLNLANGLNVLFVDQNNCNCRDNRERPEALNPSTPWCSLRGMTEYRPNHKLNPGDTVYIRHGDYTEHNASVNTSGAGPAQRITIQAYPSQTEPSGYEPVTIRGGSYNYLWILLLSNANYITLKGLHFIGYEDTPEGRLYMPNPLRISGTVGSPAQDIQILDTSVFNFQGLNDVGYGFRWRKTGDNYEPWGNAIKFDDVSNIKIENASVSCSEYSEHPTEDFRFSGDGIQFNRVSGANVKNNTFGNCGHISLTVRWSNNITVENNSCSNELHTCFAFGGSQMTIKNNLIYNWNVYPTTGNQGGHAIEMLSASDSQIYNNIIYYDANEPRRRSLHGITFIGNGDANSDRNQIYHNLIYMDDPTTVTHNSMVKAIEFNNRPDHNGVQLPNTNYIHDNKVQNNIIQLKTGGTADRPYSETYAYYLNRPIFFDIYGFEPNQGYGNEVKNNLLVTDNPGGFVMSSRNFGTSNPPYIHFDYTLQNLDNLFGTGTIVDNLGAVPAFVDLQNYDFHPTEQSSAVDAGICAPETSLDFDNRIRPQGAACDVGPFEYVYTEVTDIDQDGLPDNWELFYFGNLSQGPGDDPDFDNLTNLQEYQNGTDPTINNAAAVLNQPASPNTGNFDLTWSPVAGATLYQVQISPDPLFQNNVDERWPSGTFEPLSIATSGTYYARVQSWTLPPQDGGTTAGFSNVVQFIVDNTPPVGSIAINQGGARNARSRDVNLTLNATDLGGSHVASMQFSNDNMNWSSPIAYNTLQAWQLMDGAAGMRTVYARFIDALGNVSTDMASDTINYQPLNQTCSQNCDDEDSDGDGMPDDWEIQYFLDLSHGATEDLDNDGLTNLEEYLIDSSVCASQAGSNPTVFDSSRDCDGDSAGNISEKLDSKMTDPTDLESYPGDENLTVNSGVFWPEASGHTPVGWSTNETDATHLAQWINDPTGANRGKILMTHSPAAVPTSDLTTPKPSWITHASNRIAVDPDTWYEFSVTMAADGLEPYLNVNGEIDRSYVYTGANVNQYNQTNLSDPNGNAGWTSQDPNFSMDGPSLTDWDNSAWVYRTYQQPGPFENWKTKTIHFKTASTTRVIRLRSNQYLKGTLYLDRFVLKKVNVNGQNIDPSIPAFKRSGTLDFIQFAPGGAPARDFFPIILFGIPKDTSGQPISNYAEFKQAGFNTVGRDATYTTQIAQQLLTNDLAALPGLIHLASTINFQMWRNDPAHSINYVGALTNQNRIQTWKDFPNLLAFEEGDEMPLFPERDGAFIPNITGLAQIHNYVQQQTNPGIPLLADIDSSVYTGHFDDLVTHYAPHIDLQTFTFNTPLAYPVNNKPPQLNLAGQKIRKWKQKLSDASLSNKMIAYALGVYHWSDWDGDSLLSYVPFNIQRFQIFDQIVNGAVGVEFWGTNSINLSNIYYRHHYEQIKMLARELADIYPVLTERNFVDEWTVSDPRINVMMKKANGKTYLIAVSTHHDDIQNVQISLTPDNPITSVRALNENDSGNFCNGCSRTIPVDSGNLSFSDNFNQQRVSAYSDGSNDPNAPGYAVHIYEIENSATEGGCTNGDSDPQELANGTNVLFIDQNNCDCSNSYTRSQALNPDTPWCNLFGLRQSDYESKLNNGDTVYLRGGNHFMPLIDKFNRVVITEDDITIKSYPGESATIYASSMAPGNSGYCNQLCLGFSVLQFVSGGETNPAINVTLDSINFKGYIDNTTVQINGQNVTGRLYAPDLVRFDDAENLRIINSKFEDFEGNDDIGYGHRNVPIEMGRGITINNYYNPVIGNNLLIDSISVRCADDPSKLVAPGFSDNWNSVGFLTQSVSNVTVRNSYFGDCPGNAIEFSIAGFTNEDPHGNQQDILFENNVVNNRVKTGMYNGGIGTTSNVTVRNNRFFNYNNYSETGWSDWGAAIMMGSNVENTQIYNNIFYNAGLNAKGIDLRGTPGGLINNTKIFYNTFYSVGSSAITIENQVDPDTDVPYNTVTNTKIYNNLLYQINSVNAQSTVPHDKKRELFIESHLFEENDGYGTEIKNNLFVPARSDQNAVGIASMGQWLLNGSTLGSWQCWYNPSLAGCVWQTCGSSCPGSSNNARYRYNANTLNSIPAIYNWLDQNAIQNNIDATASVPMFIDPASGNFNLDSNSPAINAGLCVPEVTTDFAGTPRNSAGSCSIGAFEYGGASSVCGNGIIELGEQCDDSNTTNGDGCDSNCQNEVVPECTVDADCNDSNACNGTEFCSAGICESGTPLICDDGNFCNGTESCDPNIGCLNGTGPCSNPDHCDEFNDQCFACVSDSECNDGNICNGVETCVNHSCQAGAVLSCDDGIDCTVDACNVVSGCSHTPNDGVCSDGLFCTGTETCNTTLGCQPGAQVPCTGSGLSCDETNDQCVGCLNDIDCDDGNVCNGAESCQAGTCISNSPLVCDDGNLCNGTESCDPVTGCQNGSPLICDDGDVCNGTETCDAASGCQLGTPLTCTDDGNSCTSEICNPSAGCESIPVTDGTSCDDALFCNGAEICQSGFCQNAPAPCSDLNHCDEAGNQCLACISDSECNDGNICNGVESCQAGTCQSGAPLTCDDGNLCNGTESCDPALGCQSGAPLVCDDGVDCTVDSCNPSSGCAYTASDSLCSDGLFCNGAEICNATEGCQPGILTCQANEQCNEADDICVCPEGENCGPAIFTITATADNNGTILPAGNIQIVEGNLQTFEIAAKTGYRIEDVKVDGVSVGAISSYTFENIAANHTINASFIVIPEEPANNNGSQDSPEGGGGENHENSTEVPPASDTHLDTNRYFGPGIVGVLIPYETEPPNPNPKIAPKIPKPIPADSVKKHVSKTLTNPNEIATLTENLVEIERSSSHDSSNSESFITRSTRVAPLQIGTVSIQKLDQFNTEMIRLRGGPKTSGHPVKTFLEILFEILIEKAPTTISLSV